MVRPSWLVTTADQRTREINAHDPLSPCSSQHRTGTAEKRTGFSSLRCDASEVSALLWLPESSMRIEPQVITMTISLIMCTLHVFSSFPPFSVLCPDYFAGVSRDYFPNILHVHKSLARYLPCETQTRRMPFLLPMASSALMFPPLLFPVPSLWLFLCYSPLSNNTHFMSFIYSGISVIMVILKTLKLSYFWSLTSFLTLCL